jgi:hypothetical protein
MKTDELIEVLSTNLEPVDPGKVKRSLGVAIFGGLSLALVSGIVALGPRWDFHEPNAFQFLLLKLAFGVAVMLLGSVFLIKHLRPGGEFHSWAALAGVPLLIALALGAISLISVPPAHWDHMMLGHQWLECLISIPIIAVLPFALIMSAVRMAAPTNLQRTGALAGFVAGGISAIAYALHCTDDSLPFVALWYGGTIVLCTIAGGLLGPRLLRW